MAGRARAIRLAGLAGRHVADVAPRLQGSTARDGLVKMTTPAAARALEEPFVDPHRRHVSGGRLAGITCGVLIGHEDAALRAERPRLRIGLRNERAPEARHVLCPSVATRRAVERTVNGGDGARI